MRFNDPRLSYPPKLKPLSNGAMLPPQYRTKLASRPKQRTSSSGLEPSPRASAKADRLEKGSQRHPWLSTAARLTGRHHPVVVIRDQVVSKPSVDRYTSSYSWLGDRLLPVARCHTSIGRPSGARVLVSISSNHQRHELAALSSAAGASKHNAEASMLSYQHNCSERRRMQ